MARHSPVRGRATGLTGRRSERDVLDRLIDAVRAGEGRALVVTGEPGVGKTALLDYLAGHAAGFRVTRVLGVQSEMELAFAGVHQLCAPMLDHLDQLPVPQRDALRTAFGLSAGPAPERFLVGLAVLSLLAEVAGEQPLVCAVDDQQWLDRASAQVLAFVGRRLEAESVGLVLATRKPGEELAGLPALVVEGLPEGEARTLLDSVLTWPLDARVRDRIVAETRGNPLALLELPRGLTPAELAGGFGLPGAVPLFGTIEESFRRRVDALPDQTRRLLQLAAADPTGDPGLVWRAAELLGIPAEAAASAAGAELVEFGAWVRFRHPLVRSAAYQSASPQDRRDVHRALAEVTDPQMDPDRRAWHRAQAAPGPDEQVATELERSAGRAQARGGLAAAAAFLERAAVLTPDPGRRAQRLLAAARAKRDAGALGSALGLLVAVEAGPPDAVRTADVEHLRGQIAFDQRRISEAARLLLSAARRLGPLNADSARETYLEALGAAIWTADLGSAAGLREAAEAARAAPASRTGDVKLVRAALDWLSERTAVTPTDWSLGIEARIRAFLSGGEAAERLYRESIDRLGRTRLRAELARSYLLYGEWLRRERRRGDAREQLRIAHGMLDAMGIGAFAERARRELAATGETARKRTPETSGQLTAQETQIARLARDGLSNPEIGARLFISARTVQYHLGKVFTRLGIGSRSQLDRALPGDPDTVAPH